MVRRFVRVTAEEVAEGSHAIRVYYSESVNYDLSAILQPLGNGVVMLTNACGNLTNAANVEIARKALQLGYKFLKFQVPVNTGVSRWATKTATVGEFDQYIVDLELTLPRAVRSL